MRILKQFFKTTTITAMLFVGFAISGIAQDSASVDNNQTKVPVILTTNPSDGATNVDPGSVIEIVFNSEMDETSINENTLQLREMYPDSLNEQYTDMLDAEVKNPSANKKAENKSLYSTDALKGTISYSDNIAVFIPRKELKKGTMYTFTVSGDVKNVNNVPLKMDHTWTFKTTPDSALLEEKFDSTSFDQEKGRFDEVEDSSDRAIESLNEAKDSFKKDKESFNKEKANLKKDKESFNKEKENLKKDKESFDEEKDSSVLGKIVGMAMYNTKTNKIKSIDLGKAGNFVILAKTNINVESETRVTGEIGDDSTKSSAKNKMIIFNSPLKSSTAQATVTKNKSNKKDSTSTSADFKQAIEDMMAAYDNASMQNGDVFTSHQDKIFNKKDLLPGVYEWSDSLSIESDVTLSGSADDIWLFKTDKDLTVKENTTFTLTDGARAENIFWYVEGEVTIGNDAEFLGIILSKEDITLEKGAKLNGRMFSQTSINLNDNTVTEPENMDGETSSINK